MAASSRILASRSPRKNSSFLSPDEAVEPLRWRDELNPDDRLDDDLGEGDAAADERGVDDRDDTDRGVPLPVTSGSTMTTGERGVEALEDAGLLPRE